MQKLVTILIFNFVLLNHVYTQSYNFSNYSINDGLSQSVVNCVFQDSRGFIWMGTQSGLNRFNGETFDIFNYNPNDSFSISNNWIYAISEDTDGDLWIGTRGGLNKYLVKQNKFEHINYKTNFPHDVTSFCYDNICLNNGKILINTPPVLSLFDPQSGSFSHFQNKLEYDGAVKDVKIPLLEDKNGRIWVASTKGLSSFSFQTEEFTYYTFETKNGDLLENANVTALFNDKNGIIWAGTTTGLFKLNAKSNYFQELHFKQKEAEDYIFENTCIRSILEDKNGNLIIATEGSGLFVISPNSEKPASIQNYTSANSTLGHNIVQSLIMDRSENLWIGTLQGISKTDLKRKKFTLYRNSISPNSTNLLGNVIASLYKNDDGILWVGNWGQGLNLVNRETNEVEHFSTRETGNHSIPNDFAHVIFKDVIGLIWLGTRDGVLIYDKSNNTFVPWTIYFNKTNFPTFSNTRIYSIIQDSTKNYWIGTQNGLYKINLEKSTIEVFQKELDENHRLSANLVYCLLADSEGLIWIATVNGLQVYNPETKTIQYFSKEKNGMSDNFIVSLCEDSQGRIWIGTATYVNVYNKEDSTFMLYSQEHGVPNNRIFEIAKDKNNDIWLATGRGLCKFDEEQNTFHTFTLEDGLQSLEFNIRAAYVCDDGEILMGGMNGFNSFHPDSIFHNPYVPNLVFTAFYKTEDTIEESINLTENNAVTLDYKAHSFTIEFAALEYTNPNKNQYAYKMEGISNEWVDIGNRKFVPFSGLQPGEYYFQVKGSNNDGVWNNDAIGIRINILPPWWRSNYAYSFYILLLFIGVYGFIKMREKKLKHDKKILEKKVLERTIQIEHQNRKLEELNQTKNKLFSIIGHDLGNQFNIIVGFSDLLLSDFRKLDAAKIEYHLRNIYESSSHANHLLENLLTWARMQTKSIRYNPVVFNVNEKIEELIQFHKEALNKKRIILEFENKNGIMVKADVNMFSTVLRNLVANAIKFTHENGHIYILSSQMKDFCEIKVKDNGVGIESENLEKIFRIDSKHKTTGTKGEKGTGLGLILCKEFVEKNNGKIWVKSESGKGSEFCFTIPNGQVEVNSTVN
ncbi:ATP-binding protein [Prolixibacteraceae bacterium Z1-6]|uniref:histidine kinase n=1 Tax=Draconibacterium aestuarii TaxID=2998507 RepID=A0A9X3F2R6_9BACT|nr:ATP-binding protein [Prolixibacteraceae bacterium Z1-6]